MTCHLLRYISIWLFNHSLTIDQSKKFKLIKVTNTHKKYYLLDDLTDLNPAMIV